MGEKSSTCCVSQAGAQFAKTRRPTKRRTMESNDLVTVYTVGNPVQAEIIKNALQAEGIRCFLDGINQAAEAGLIGLKIGVEGAPADADRARKLVESHDAAKKAKPHTWTEKK